LRTSILHDLYDKKGLRP